MKKSILPRFYGGFFSITGKVFCLSLILLAVFVVSCEDEGLIGLDMVDDQANIQVTDTLTMFAYSQLEDSVPTNSVANATLGIINDPIFGKSQSSFYTEVRLSDNDISLGENPVLDSVILKFKYSGHYGDSLSRQTINVYELSERFPEDSVIFSNQTIEYNEIPLAVQEYMIRPNDSLMVDSVLRAPHLRIKLSQEFGERLIAQNDTENFENNSNFLDFFNGLYITVEDHEEAGNIAYFDLIHSLSTITLYYKNDEETDDPDKSIAQQFPINSFCSKFNHFENFDFAGSIDAVQQQVIQGDTLLGDSLLFIQGLHGLRVRFEIPHLDDLNEEFGSIAMNQAKLIIPVDESYINSFYPPPSRLLLLGLDVDDTPFNIVDSELGNAIYGGDYNEETAQYEFNITSHMQRIAIGEYTTSTFFIRTPNPMENAHRAVLRGPGRANNNLRIEIIFSTFN